VGGFEVLRYNQEGFTDPALNGTIGVDLAREGELTALTISVSDPAAMNSAIVLVNYDSALAHPERAEFHGLLGGEGQVLSASFLDTPGTAGMGEAAIRDYDPGNYSGDLVTVYFADGPKRNISVAGGVHSNPYGVANQYLTQATAGPQNMFASSDKDAGTANVYWTAGWHCGDGDQNSETNPADLVPLAQNFLANTADDWSAVVADYDLNTEVNPGDIVRIATFFSERTTAYDVAAADNDGSGRTAVGTLAWDDNNPATGGAAGELKSAYKYWEMNFDSTTTDTMTYDQLAALDANDDGLVKVYVTPVGADSADKGVESGIDVEVGTGTTGTPKSLIITGYDIEVVGATDGSGGDIFDGDGATAAPDTVIIENANSQVTFQLNAIKGTFEGVNFSKDNLASSQGMTQTHYDNALASARTQVSWTFDHGGAAGFRRTSDWIALDAGNPGSAPFTVTGDPGQGTVFPDDDPESVGPEAEGKLTT